MNNKQSHKAQITRLSMLIIMLLLSNLCMTTLASYRWTVSNKDSKNPVCQYFKKIPKREDFKNWSAQVVEIVEKYGLKEYLGEWLEDIATIDKVLTSLDKTDKDPMDFKTLIQKYHIKQPIERSDFWSVLLCYGAQSSSTVPKLVIKNIAPDDLISTDPVIAVIDELYRVSDRDWQYVPFSITSFRRSVAVFHICLKICKEELNEKHRMYTLLTISSYQGIISSIPESLGIKLSSTPDNKVKKTP